jgi:predicted lipid carrier protein YhbT
MMALRGPVELLLGRALRRVSRRQPAVFARLGAFQSATFMILPTGWPVAFALSPRLGDGEVRVVRRDAPGPFAARIEGPLLDLLGLFDGSLDADAAFFARSVQVEGDTSAVMALHNALEAADLTLADLVGPPVGGELLNRGFEALRSAARRRSTEPA